MKKKKTTKDFCNPALFEKRFKDILGDLNTISKMNREYMDLSCKLAFLVGNMLGYIMKLEQEQKK